MIYYQALRTLFSRVLLVPLAIYLAAAAAFHCIVPPFSFAGETPAQAASAKECAKWTIAVSGGAIKCERSRDAKADKRVVHTGQFLVVSAGFVSVLGIICAGFWVRMQISLRQRFSDAATISMSAGYAVFAVILVGIVAFLAPTSIEGWWSSVPAGTGVVGDIYGGTKLTLHAHKIEGTGIAFLIRIMDAVSIAMSVMIAWCASLALDPASHDLAKDKDVHWAREFTYLRECLYVGAAILVLRIIWISAILQWPAELLIEDERTAYKNFVSSTVTFWSLTFTAMLLGMYLVATQILALRARDYFTVRNWRPTLMASAPPEKVRAAAQRLGLSKPVVSQLAIVPDQDIDRILKDGGAQIGDHVARIIAMLAPLFAGTALTSIAGLFK